MYRDVLRGIALRVGVFLAVGKDLGGLYPHLFSFSL